MGIYSARKQTFLLLNVKALRMSGRDLMRPNAGSREDRDLLVSGPGFHRAARVGVLALLHGSFLLAASRDQSHLSEMRRNPKTSQAEIVGEDVT